MKAKLQNASFEKLPMTLPEQSGEEVSLGTQSFRLLALYHAAIDKENLSVASSVLKQLSDLHNLSKAGPLHEALERLSEKQLDERIGQLIRQAGLDLPVTATGEPPASSAQAL